MNFSREIETILSILFLTAIFFLLADPTEKKKRQHLDFVIKFATLHFLPGKTESSETKLAIHGSNFWPRVYLRNVRFVFFLSWLSRGRFPIGARLHVKISARSVYFRRKTREPARRGRARGCVYARVHAKRTRRESAQASNFTGNTRG